MDKSFVILLLCLASVLADTEMNMGMAKDMMADKMADSAMMPESMAKPKRDSWGSTPCPPIWGQIKGGWMPEQPKVHIVQQPIHKPTVTIVKPQQGWQPNPWQQNTGWNKYGWNKPVTGWPMTSGWKTPGWQPQAQPWKPQPWQPQPWKPQEWKPQSWQPQPWQPSGWQKPLIKPAVVEKPDCPPWQHQHPHQTGIVYAPKYVHQEPQIWKPPPPPVWKPSPPVWKPSPPVWKPSPPVWKPSPPVWNPPVKDCDK